MVTGLEGETCGEAGDLISDFMDDLELLGAVDGLGMEIVGAALSAVHLHCSLISIYSRHCTWPLAYPEKFPKSGVIGLAWLPLDILQVLSVTKSQYL